MFRRLKQFGFLFSAAAILFTAFFLPFHCHKEDLSASSKTNCSICQFSSETRTASPTPAFAGPSPLHPLAFFLPQENLSSSLRFFGLPATRAPPLA